MKKNIRKILIANRGEIAIRVMRSCRILGIPTVAVFSDADAGSPYLRYADETYHIGNSPARESYLDIDKILDVARSSGADAIHPGYGFLSENPSFVERVETAGLVFIGPSSAAIRKLGDKTSAKELAKAAGVPVVPGTVRALSSSSEAIGVASSIGYPVMLKAAAGGGGKGMRIVREEVELERALAMAMSEAKSSFSDERVYMEKYIQDPRHIEVQILGDSFGRVIHLGERECSVQRRHQKIIEESPSPAVGETLRAALTGAAVKLASSVGYTNAGTVEFIMDREGNFYFMEVNTRLQVEHPVTEFRTGVDIVAEQIRIAAGEPISIPQEEVGFSGHALECRIYAEDSANGFLPYTGRIEHIAHPAGPGIRLDTGLENGSEISPYYDPMISKVISFGPSREAALARMRESLESYEIYGVKTNIDLLLWVLADPDFIAGEFDTNFLGRKYSPGLFTEAPQEIRNLSALVAASLQMSGENRFRRQPQTREGHDARWTAQRGEAMR
jgi:acetyl-CoA carboxylase biotin carboxylase subunit